MAKTLKREKTAVFGCFFLILVAGVGFEPHDLRVMSPTSYRTAPSRDRSDPESGTLSRPQDALL